MFPDDLIAKAETVVEDLRRKNLKLATAESCTGGSIAGVLTEIAGASDVFERGYVTYSNDAKAEEISVPINALNTHGAVSSDVATTMAEGALTKSKSDIAVAVTGIAGPTGGTEQKPVGLVFIAVAAKDQNTVYEKCLFGDVGRTEIRKQTIIKALDMVLEQVKTQ